MNFFKGKHIQIIGFLAIITSLLLSVPFSIPTSLAVTSLGGSAGDIQAAVDQVVASGGIGDVHIPEGTFNFVEPGEPWTPVVIPAGVSLFGAPTERTSGQPEPAYGRSPNDQVVEWKTILVMPYDVPSGTNWFLLQGNGDPNKLSRFSDIALKGYRSIDPTSTTMHNAMTIKNVVDYRIDHNLFEHTASGIWVGGYNLENTPNRGVFDHNHFVNDYGVVSVFVADCTVTYGIGMGRVHSDYWDSDISNILGKYLDYTIVIEDNYFRRWRHVTASNHGQHYVFRHNTIENDAGFGSIDGHGTYSKVGTRAMEIYNNEIIDPVNAGTYNSNTPKQYGKAVFWRGGGGVFFNNYIRNYGYIIEFQAEDWSGVAPYTYPHDVWIWNNDDGGAILYSVSVPPVNEQEDFWVAGTSYWATPPQNTYPLELPKPGTGEPSVMYTPYPYPHPLVSGETPPPPANGGNGSLNVIAKYDDQEITVDINVAGTTTTYSGQTPYVETLPIGVYNVTATSAYGTLWETVQVFAGQVTTVTFSWSSTEPPDIIIETPFEMPYMLMMQLSLVAVGIVLVYRGRKP